MLNPATKFFIKKAVKAQLKSEFPHSLLQEAVDAGHFFKLEILDFMPINYPQNQEEEVQELVQELVEEYLDNSPALHNYKF